METENNKMEIDNPIKEKTIKTALNDISSDLSTLSVDVKSMSEQLPSLATTREEVNAFKLKIEAYDKKLDGASAVIKKGVDVRISPLELSDEHCSMLDSIKENLETKNRRWSTLCNAIASAGKGKVILTPVVSVAITAATMLLAYENSPHVWAHRAFVSAEELHVVNPAEEYSKAFVEMRSGRKVMKACKERIESMESEAKYIKKLEGILSGYTEKEVEVHEYQIRIKDEQRVLLVCYHPSANQKVNYRMNTTPEGIVTKVEMEQKSNGKNGSAEWIELKGVESE